MRGARLLWLAAALGAAGPALAGADENRDLDLIPPALEESAPADAAPGPAAAAGARSRIYLEDAAALFSQRHHFVVPLPPQPSVDWQNRTSLDASGRWRIAPGLEASFSDHLNLIAENDTRFPSRQSVRNDLREAFLTWEPAQRAYLEAGRINVRNGVAMGFNPTDFFRPRTLVEQASLDPSVIRQDRLGTVMARAQSVWEGGAASLAVAPKLDDPSRITTRPEPGIGAKLGRTNGSDRLLLSLTEDVYDLAPEALLFRDGGRTRFGLNLSRPLGPSVVAYAEWAGGREATLLARAVEFGKETGTLPRNAPLPIPGTTGLAFRNDAALGASWTTGNLTLNLEYHYHEAGFSAADLRRWFAIGGARGAPPPLTGELWFVRAYASDQQEPLSRHQAFLRAQWTDAFVRNLTLSGFAFVNLYDGSTLAQLAATYDLSDAWSVGAYAAASLGGPRTERGSAPQAGSAILQLVRYF